MSIILLVLVHFVSMVFWFLVFFRPSEIDKMVKEAFQEVREEAEGEQK